MNTKLEFSGLELDLSAWNKNISSGVNSVLSDALEMAPGPNGELIFTNATASNMGGGLISRHLPYPGGIALPYVELYLEFLLPTWSRASLLRLECDLKAAQTSTAANSGQQNVADGSAQNNVSKAGGTWQIDGVTLDTTTTPPTTKAGWVDTPYNPGLPPAETWTPLSIKQFHDFANKKCSVLSITQGGGAPFVIPSALQNQPQLIVPGGWGAGVNVQLQTESAAGAVQVIYRNITVRMSAAAL